MLFLIFIIYITKIITNPCCWSLPVPRRSCTVEIWGWIGMGRGIFFRFPRLLFLADIKTEIITESKVMILHKFIPRIYSLEMICTLPHFRRWWQSKK